MTEIIKLSKKKPVQFITVKADDIGQRIDNFLINHLKGMPKSRIYRIVRKGEVRVNKKRVAVNYRILTGDVIRLPPIMLEEKAKTIAPSTLTMDQLKSRIIFEDENIIIINKPAGMAVHGGSKVRIGVIEALRHAFPKIPNLELVHRLDSETSGCLILAKRKRILRDLHDLLRKGQVKKIYWTLTKGTWKKNELKVDVPLLKSYHEGGKHVVNVSASGKEALTMFKTLESFEDASLMEVRLMTGRTHQIRVHARYRGHPIACDDRYGDREFNKLTHQLGLKRLFLHAREIDFILPSTGQRIRVLAPLESDLERIINVLRTRQKRFVVSHY